MAFQTIDVLIVDDSDADAELAMRALRGLRCLRLVDGEQAVDYILSSGLYRDKPRVLPQLVLLDINLPRVNGFEVLTEIRAYYPPGELPIVVFTGSSNELLEASCLEAGANAYVIKPVEHDAFVTRLWAEVSKWVLLAPKDASGHS